ncbi:MAG: peptidoglycan editing factor PgeF [Patescibacteria group bacterium]
MIIFDPNKKIYYSTKINSPDIFSAFGTKALNATDDNKAVEEFCKENDINLDIVYRPVQVHSSKVKIVENTGDVAKEEGDGVITDKKNVALVIRTADCVPIIFSDKKVGTVGISHQGWRGTFDEMVKEMIQNFESKGSKKKDLSAAIGPCIGLCCFEVKDDVFSLFKDKFNKYHSEVTVERDDKKYINLAHLNYLLMLECGLTKDQIDHFPFCTFCNKDLFFSYRRDYHTNYAQFGQQLSFIIRT